MVIALDFSKAFDTVRQANLLRKIALLNIPDPVHNWLVEFFNDHTHCTRFSGFVSGFQRITASIIQGSAVGLVSFVINASDLSTVTPGNRMIKYANDTYIVIPACNIQSRVTEREYVADWVQKNNLKFNRAKSVETVITDSRRKSNYTAPPILPDICRVENGTSHINEYD